jgi:hypothetical protein
MSRGEPQRQLRPNQSLQPAVNVMFSFGNSRQAIEITGAHFDDFFQSRLEIME